MGKKQDIIILCFPGVNREDLMEFRDWFVESLPKQLGAKYHFVFFNKEVHSIPKDDFLDIIKELKQRLEAEKRRIVA